MQREVWERLREEVKQELSASDSKEPKDFDDFGFHYPVEYVGQAAALLKLSNFTCWPESGGWADQDAFLVDDVMRWLNIRARFMWKLKYG
jgi:hypothetical protein